MGLEKSALFRPLWFVVFQVFSALDSAVGHGGCESSIWETMCVHMPLVCKPLAIHVR